MGLLDVSARTWHAPSKSDQVHKHDLYRLEEYERTKKRERKNELETLERVEHILHDNARHDAQLLRAQGHRSLSNKYERQELAHLQAEGNARLNADTLGISGALSDMGMVSRANPAAENLFYQREGEYALRMAAAGAVSRMRSLSAAEAANQQFAAERLRLAECKVALHSREYALQNAREARLRQSASMMELMARDRKLREYEHDHDMRIRAATREDVLNRAEQELRDREMSELVDEDMERKLQDLAVNSTHHHHNRTPSIGLDDNLRSSPKFFSDNPLVVVGLRSLGTGTSPRLESSPFHLSGSPDVSSDDAMLAEAAALGVNFPSRSPHTCASPSQVGGLGEFDGIEDLDGLDDIRRGSLASLGDSLEIYDDYGRGRRDSVPFEETQLFDTRGY